MSGFLSSPVGIALIVVLALSAAVAVSFNRFVLQRNHVRESWGTIDVELRRRYDLIPNLVSAVKGYAAHERAVLEEVIAARAAAIASTGAVGQQARDEGPVVAALRHLFAVAENYPDLKASAHFGELQQELAHTENRLAAARRFYNGNVRDLNRRVRSFPSNVVASVFGFREADYFEVDESLRRSVPASEP